jgi:hypothetical protein
MHANIFTFSAFTVQYVNLSAFASIVVKPRHTVGNRRNTVSVQNPSLLVSRKDGQFTIKAGNKANTRTVSLRGASVYLTTRDGVTQEYLLD